jgi:putative ABC transport system permease protein
VRTEIVGVVKSKALGAEQRTTEPTLFLPMLQDFLPRMTAMLVAPAADAAIVRTLQRRMAAVPGGRSDRMTVRLLDAYLGSTTLAPTRIATVFVTTFAALALLLGALGLYGAMAESARRRQREFAMRLALGAQSWRVMRQLMIEGMRLAAVGTAAGMVVSFGAARSLARLTPGAEWPPLSIWLAAPLLLAAAVAVASIIPARRAASVDLLSLMRQM